MKRVQLNFQEMVAAVLAHAKKHTAAWQDVEPVAESIHELQELNTEVDVAAGKQTQRGTASPKDTALAELFAEVQKTGGRIASFARRQHDELLEAQVRIRVYQLDEMAEAEALRRCTLVRDKAVELLPQLAAYKVTADSIAALNRLLATATSMKENFVDNRTDATAQTGKLPSLESRQRRVLESLDIEVENMVDDEDFVNGYFVARRIWDRRGRGKNKEQETGDEQ